MSVIYCFVFCREGFFFFFQVTDLGDTASDTTYLKKNSSNIILSFRSSHFMLTFDPLTGAVKSNEALPVSLDQALLLPELAGHELRPVLIVGKEGRALIYPPSAAGCLASAPPLFVATVSPNGDLIGNLVGVKEENRGELR